MGCSGHQTNYCRCFVHHPKSKTSSPKSLCRDLKSPSPPRPYPPPCCGYISLIDGPGQYDICSICFWEDDLSQLRFPTTIGANRVSLIDAQKNYTALGASEERLTQHVRRPTTADQRDPLWRPLDPNKDNIEIPIPGKDYGKTIDRPRCYDFAGLFLDARKQELRSADGALIDLTETEFRLLEMFLMHPGRVLSRDEITQMLRGHDWSPLDRVIDGHVSRLRRKVDSLSDEEPRLIRSVRGVGYVFAGEITLT